MAVQGPGEVRGTERKNGQNQTEADIVITIVIVIPTQAVLAKRTQTDCLLQARHPRVLADVKALQTLLSVL